MIQSMASFRQVCIRHSGGKNLHLEVGKLGGDWNFRWKLPPFKGYIKALYTYDHMYMMYLIYIFWVHLHTVLKHYKPLSPKNLKCNRWNSSNLSPGGRLRKARNGWIQYWVTTVVRCFGLRCWYVVSAGSWVVLARKQAKTIYIYMHVQFIIAWIWHLSIDKKTPLLCLLKSSQAMKRRGFPGSQDSAGGLLKPFDLWWLRTTKDHDFPCHVLVCVQAEHIGT